MQQLDLLPELAPEFMASNILPIFEKMYGEGIRRAREASEKKGSSHIMGTEFLRACPELFSYLSAQDNLGQGSTVYREDGTVDRDGWVSFGSHSWMYVATTAWRDFGKPSLLMDEDLASMLLHTDLPPAEEVAKEKLPEMPWPCFVIRLPPLFQVHNEVSGEHLVEGILLYRDWVTIPDTKENKECILIMVLGEDKARKQRRRTGATYIDDAMVFTMVAEGQHPTWVSSAAPAEALVSLRNAVRIVWNFLYLFNSGRTDLLMDKVTPELPKCKSAKKQKRLGKKLVGKSTLPYFKLGVKGSLKTGNTSFKKGVAEHGEASQLLVRGHFKRQWELESTAKELGHVPLRGEGTEAVSKTGKKMVCVRKFVAPYFRLSTSTREANTQRLVL